MDRRHGHAGNQSVWSPAFLALGIVFGDIGTSPLYALKETFFGHHPLELTTGNILGALSLFFWSLAVVITFKYVYLIMKADNGGEGGIFSLLGLIRQQKESVPPRLYGNITLLILVGAALLYGDGVITPAISVLSAVEGLAVVTPAFSRAVVPLTLAILFGLFAIQKRGTHLIGRSFAPAMTVWFLMLVAFAIPQLWARPQVFLAVNPLYALSFLWQHGWHSLWVLGAVVLCVTGGEALYADMGHLGRNAISRAWFVLVWPALLLNYFGQGARLLDPAPIPGNNLFYALAPSWALVPAVVISTVATVIASQALITGCYSLTQQAIALGVFPRIRIKHTNEQMQGQIYLPFINWALFAGCALLVLGFRSSGALAAAYGIAVTGTMAITTAAFYVVAHHRWGWSRNRTMVICGLLIVIDMTFFTANALKFFHGGYVPLLMGAAVFSVMWVWRWGRKLVAGAYAAYDTSRKISWLVELKGRLDRTRGVLKDQRIRRLVESDRAAVFLTSRLVDETTDSVPVNLRIFLKRNGVLPKYVVILNIVQEKVPYIPQEDRYRVFDFGQGIFGIQARYGFMQNPDARRVIRELPGRGLIPPQVHRCIIEVGEEEVIIHPSAPLKERMFGKVYQFLLQNAVPAHRYFGLAAVSGLAKTLIPVSIDRQGARVELPEFALDRREEAAGIDPDTLKPTEVPYAKPEED